MSRPGKPSGNGIYEFTASTTTCILCHKTPFEVSKNNDYLAVCEPAIKRATGLRLAIADGQKPVKFGGSEGVIEFQLAREGGNPHPPIAILAPNTEQLKATASLRVAQKLEAAARMDLLNAQLGLDLAKSKYELAMRQVEEARARIAAIEKENATPRPPKPIEKDSFSVHIRTQFAPEKVVRVKTTGTQTVLEGLAYAAEDMAIKPEAISVWVVRDKGILPVDLAAIIQKADPKTNYQLKTGDQLFVQVKVEK
jgi:hypothetical protein